MLRTPPSDYAVHLVNRGFEDRNAPYVVCLQSFVLQRLDTVVVAPIYHALNGGQVIGQLNLRVDLDCDPGANLVLTISEMAGIARRDLGERVDSLWGDGDRILGAIELVFTGMG
ncbi:CcdB family protein [Spiribacter vilamensis]|uniref:Toxin CcdB n=1 Tax=Spiribacter vilamensis TaxID=531306 RepID=A0A4Q8D182_9GAMM|nr:CcdB family protein [Spiribacter vilamensis]RZU99078.1 CcdB protein [Spiribacter vilamensis]TVO61924.1 plasmid maintenance protein CcdB [Spiribacter vilamensis]